MCIYIKILNTLFSMTFRGHGSYKKRQPLTNELDFCSTTSHFIIWGKAFSFDPADQIDLP